VVVAALALPPELQANSMMGSLDTTLCASSCSPLLPSDSNMLGGRWLRLGFAIVLGLLDAASRSRSCDEHMPLTDKCTASLLFSEE
jgi:hypothetical protein